MSITSKILPTGDAVEVKALRQLYNQALAEKWELERELNLLTLGTAGRAKLQLEIAKLHDIMIPADQRIYLIIFYEYERRKTETQTNKGEINLRETIYKIDFH